MALWLVALVGAAVLDVVALSARDRLSRHESDRAAHRRLMTEIRRHR